MIKNRKLLQTIRFIIQACFMASLFYPILPHSETVANWLFWTVPIFGVFFCGWVCPFGIIQDWLAKSAIKCKFPHYKMPLKVQKYLQFSRYIFLCLMFLGITFSFSNNRFYFQDNLIHNMLTWKSGIALAIFLIISLFFDRPFCNYICIKGAVDGLMSVVRPISIKKDEEKCIHCHLCNKVCPMNINVEQTKFMRHPNCINCMQCVSTCSKDCIKYQLLAIRKIKFNKNKP